MNKSGKQFLFVSYFLFAMALILFIVTSSSAHPIVYVIAITVIITFITLIGIIFYRLKKRLDE